MATATAGGRRRYDPQRGAAHREAYRKGLEGEPAGDAETNDPKLRATYRKGLRARRGEEPIRKTGLSDVGKRVITSEPSTSSAESKPASSATPKTPAAQGLSVPTTVRKVGGSSGGFVLGMFAYAIAINYLRYGWPGVRALGSAKLFNKVVDGPWNGHTSGATPIVPGPGSGGGGGFRPTSLGSAV